MGELEDKVKSLRRQLKDRNREEKLLAEEKRLTDKLRKKGLLEKLWEKYI